MGHSHPHDTAKALRLAFVLNTTFAILEIFGGLWTNSVAILSDAVHDLGDSVALGAAWALDRYSQKAGDRRFSYGYLRFSLLGAWTNTTVLVLGSILVLTEAVPRLFRPEPANARGMLLFALIGILVNGAAAWRLHGQTSLNTKVAAWHLIEDVLGWVAVFVVAITLLFVDLPILDPLLSIGITIYILTNVLRNLRRTLMLFLQAVPEDIDLDELQRRLDALDHVRSTHHTHVWSMDGAHHVLSTHLVVDSNATKENVTRVRAAVATLCEEYRFAHSTVEIEWGDDECRMGEQATGT
jgi:cobalt-zinc-cadmium efflux system protein